MLAVYYMAQVTVHFEFFGCLIGFCLFSQYDPPICLLLAATVLVYGSLGNQATDVGSALGRTVRTW